MSEEAPLKTLLAKVIDNRGRTCPTTDDGMPLIATNCVHNTGLYPTFEKIRHVDEETYQGWFRGHPEPGDLIFVLKGTPGRVCLTPDPVTFCIAQDMVALRADPTKVEPSYLFAALRSPQIQAAIGNLHVGSMIAHFKKGDFDRLMIPLPEKSAQKDIGDFYLEVSKKIELNRRMSATLEEMARALYRSWFVDFDPVHARALGQPPAHMAPTTAALFPDSFGPDGLPKGWEMSTIGDVAETVGGATPKTREPSYWDGPHRWATPRDLSKLSQPVLFETDRTLTDAGLAKVSSGMSPAGTVLLSSRAPIGYVVIAQNPVAVNQGFIALRETDRISSVEAYFWVHANMNAILANANGSTFQEISKKNFRPLPCVLAPDPVRNAFRGLAGIWFDRVTSLCAENANLATLRDALLPRLMSGELRIREAVKQVEELV